MNLLNVYRCQRNRFLRFLWNQIEEKDSLKRVLTIISKPLYIKFRYFMMTGCFLKSKEKLHTIDEKTHWLAAYWRNPLIVKCADKYLVREYITSCGCSDILNELYASFDNVDDINFDVLPNSFVLKANNGTGANIFCYEKNNFDIDCAVDTIRKWSEKPFGVTSVEFQYNKIPFKIICEKLLVAKKNHVKEGESLVEYQVFCFNGEPESILVRTDLETSGDIPYALTMSLQWERLHYRISEDDFDFIPEKPVFLDKMIDYAKRLSNPFPQVRVDFYGIGPKLVFGEMTFSTHGNVYSNYKDEIRLKWGNILELPQKYTKSDRY